MSLEVKGQHSQRLEVISHHVVLFPPRLHSELLGRGRVPENLLVVVTLVLNIKDQFVAVLDFEVESFLPLEVLGVAFFLDGSGSAGNCVVDLEEGFLSGRKRTVLSMNLVSL